MDQVKAGVAKAVITPPLGTELWGYARQGKYAANGVYDPLYVRVLVLDPPEEAAPIALITLDLGGISGKWADEVRLIIKREAGIPCERLIFSATHTHAGPAPFKCRHLGEPNERYLQTLKDRVVATVKAALANRVLVAGGEGTGRVDLSINRRERSPNGPVDQDPGNVDPQVRVYRLDKQDGQPLALLVNYTAHPNTLPRDNRKFSADYPGVMIKILEKHLGAQVFFLQGAAGNIDPRFKGDYRATKQIGAMLAEEVRHINTAIQTQPLRQVSISQSRAFIFWQPPPPLEQLRRELEEDQSQLMVNSEEPPCYGIPGWRKHRIEWRKSLLNRLQTTGNPPPLSVPLHVLFIDKSCWVTLPGEPFVELGQKLQDAWPHGPVFILGYSNDTTMGYIPTESAYAAGGYEVDVAFRYYGLDLPVAKGTGEQLVRKLKELIECNGPTRRDHPPLAKPLSSQENKQTHPEGLISAPTTSQAGFSSILAPK